MPPRLPLSGPQRAGPTFFFRGGRLECVAASSLRAPLCLGTRRGRAASHPFSALPPQYPRVLPWALRALQLSKCKASIGSAGFFCHRLDSGWSPEVIKLELLLSFLGVILFAARVRGDIKAALTCITASRTSKYLDLHGKLL